MRKPLTRLVALGSALALLLLVSVVPAAAISPGRVVRIVGTTVEIVDDTGRHRSGLELGNVELTLGEGADAARLRVVAVVADSRAGVWLHEVESLDASTGQWTNICAPDRDNRRLALFIEGHDLPDGSQVHVPDQLSVTCSAGVQGKCLRAGYFPWDNSRGSGSGAALFQTCTRMFRADYCGDGIGWTRNGMAIDIFDLHAIQQPAVPATLPFEAAWGPQGALCVHHTRVPDRGRLAALLEQCPRLAALPHGAACTEASAAGLPGALLFNRSADPLPR